MIEKTAELLREASAFEHPRAIPRSETLTGPSATII